MRVLIYESRYKERSQNKTFVEKKEETVCDISLSCPTKHVDESWLYDYAVELCSDTETSSCLFSETRVWKFQDSIDVGFSFVAKSRNEKYNNLTHTSYFRNFE